MFSSFAQYLNLKLHTMIACNIVQHLVEVKPLEKIFVEQIWANRPKSDSKLGFFAIFSSLVY